MVWLAKREFELPSYRFWWNSLGFLSQYVMQPTANSLDTYTEAQALLEGEWIVIDPQGMVVYWLRLTRTHLEFHPADRAVQAAPATIELSKIQRVCNYQCFNQFVVKI